MRIQRNYEDIPEVVDICKANIRAPEQFHGDPTRIKQVLINLVSNGIKYNRPGGRIRVYAREAGEMVEVSVENTGRQIPPEVQGRIFERFNRGSVGENVPGYGLGLNLARELARLHGGDLRLVGSNESGTRFEVRLRRAG